MFKTHKIWFSPEFALHLGSAPAVMRRARSHPRGPPTKDFFKPFIYACAFATVCVPASCTIRDSLQDRACVALISFWLTPPPPFTIFMPHHAHLPSTVLGAGGEGGCCFICMVRRILRFPAVADLFNFSSLVSNKATDSLSTSGSFQVVNKMLIFDGPFWALSCVRINIYFTGAELHCLLYLGKTCIRTAIQPVIW